MLRWRWQYLFVALELGEVGASPDFVHRFPHIKPPVDFNAIAAGDVSPPRVVGGISKFAQNGENRFDIDCGADKLRIIFYREDIVRIWLAWGGKFTDPATDDIVVGAPQATLRASFADKGSYYEMHAGQPHGVVLRAAKTPLRFTLLRYGRPLLSEAAGLTLNATASFQTLNAGPDEYYFGGGMQNGRFSHRGHRIRVSTDDNWADGGNPNAAPFFLSSAGYGVYRNTWSPGYYDFSASPTVLAHNETRFDAFYFAAALRDFKALLEAYTFITGRPFMPPIYGLGMGDSDCYHNERHAWDTRVVTAVAAKYRRFDMPAGWILPNDGYGCGYGAGNTKFPRNFSILDEVVEELHQQHFQTGLWSSTGLPNITREVNGSGIRIAKTDVGWIGNGYKYAFDAVKTVVAGIEDNSDARRFIWTVEGWAGTQRYAVMWTGDNSGSFEYLRWQIPTYVGAGFSAQAHVSGDVDGIFGGSPETYVRDLQFKCMMTVLMSMSGWAPNPDKQPWTWGDPFTSINRLYLKLKAQLTPYFYSLSRMAYQTGLPPVRAMALEFPDDVSTFLNHTGSSQQFMSGPWFLVAPVYRPLMETQVRDGIYLPRGEWVDYWSGAIRSGPNTVNGYEAPLDRLPLFVRAGAIIPMWEPMLYADKGFNDLLVLDVYPAGESRFGLYEDDGLTRQALEGSAYSWTNISCKAEPNALSNGGDVTLTVGPSVGQYTGKPKERRYSILFHMPRAPHSVDLLTGTGKITLPEYTSSSALDFAAEGWFFTNADGRGGVVKVKTGPCPASDSVNVELLGPVGDVLYT